MADMAWYLDSLHEQWNWPSYYRNQVELANRCCCGQEYVGWSERDEQSTKMRLAIGSSERLYKYNVSIRFEQLLVILNALSS
jgi:hypothetical protein